MKLIGVSIHVSDVDHEEILASLEEALKKIQTDYPGMAFELVEELPAEEDG